MRHGFLLIDKPEGPTSHDIVAKVRRSLPERKVGHLGTLDPAASGLLVLAVGAKALKVVELYTDLTKQYEAGIRLGAQSATFDREGPIELVKPKPGVAEPDDNAILQTIRTKFVGNISQVPPAASAVHVDGERAYKAMREGRDVDLPERNVRIDECKMLAYTYPDLTLSITCSSGTYIRSLAHDLGQALRVGGYLASLRRTKVGNWSVEDALDPDKVAWGHVVPLKEVLQGLPKRELTDAELTDLSHGKYIEGTCTPNMIGWNNGLPVALLEKRDEGVKARKVL